MTRSVDIEHKGVTYTVTCIIYDDRVMHPDSWWQEDSIRSDGDIGELMLDLAEHRWTLYDELMDQVEAKLKEEV